MVSLDHNFLLCMYQDHASPFLQNRLANLLSEQVAFLGFTSLAMFGCNASAYLKGFH